MNALIEICAIPLLLAAFSLVLPKLNVIRLIVALGHWVQLLVLFSLTWSLLTGAESRLVFTPDFALDRLGAAFILLTTLVVASASTHMNYFFSREKAKTEAEIWHCKVFYFCVNTFLAAMTFIFLCDNLGFLWISLEATTLSSAPLVYFDRSKNALEATWKYLIICSVGIAFALLGTVFIFAAGQHGENFQGSLNISVLISHAGDLNFSMLRLGFIFTILGYGTKAGIFPLHSWMPDAYSEAPAPASAMLSGAFLNCALFGIWRVSQIVVASGHQLLTSEILVSLGTITVVAGSLFLIHQHSFKRMWAYSSIENVGLMLVAIGINSGPLFFLQAINHSIAKVALFLLSGNIIQAYGSKRLHDLRGVVKAYPLWGGLLLLAAMAITGVPPFGSFVSEMAIVTASASLGNWLTVGFLVLAITVSFVAVALHVGRILVGNPKAHDVQSPPIAASIVPAMLILGSFVLGIMFRLDDWMGLQ